MISCPNEVVSLIIYNCSASGFNQFGLYHDDCRYENDDVKEALRRLPAVRKIIYNLFDTSCCHLLF